VVVRPALLARSRSYWDRMTGLLALFAATGYLEGEYPQSVLLTGKPGRGKTKMLMRFKLENPFLSVQSDLTVRQLYPLLRQAKQGHVTHIIAPEVQKFFQRKESVANNCLTTLAEAMSEGVHNASVGPRSEDFGGAQLGLLGAITDRTMRRKGSYLDELGFLDRTTLMPWLLTDAEIKQIMTNITRGNRAKLVAVRVVVPEEPVRVRIPVSLGRTIQRYAWHIWRGESLRPLERLRGLVMAAALVRGARRATPADWRTVASYDEWWKAAFENAATST
jgi:hypothetical protein